MAARSDAVPVGIDPELTAQRKDDQLHVRFPSCYKELDNPYRYKICYGGRGAARSWTISAKLLLRGMERKLLILCTRELQKSIRGSVYRLLCNQIERLGLQDYYPAHLRTGHSIGCVTGTEFIFMGTRYNADEIKSTEGIDIVWIEEAHNLTDDSWDLIDPTIRKEGSEIWASFNTRFKFDTLYHKFVVSEPPEDSLVIQSDITDNPYATTVLWKQYHEMRERDYDNWLHVWKGQLKTLSKGAVFGKQITELRKAGRFLYIGVEKSSEVYTFNDVGKNDPCAWWFVQHAGGQIRMIDYYHARFEDIDHYVKVLKALGYNYGEHKMPHDADHDRLGMTRTIKEQFEDGGVRPVEIVPRISDKEIAIQLGRDMMGKCWFHHHVDDRPEEECEGYISWLPEGWRTRAQRMEQGWEMLCHYRYKYNDDSGEFSLKPEETGLPRNAADAFMQLAQSWEVPEHDDWFTKDIPNETGHIV